MFNNFQLEVKELLKENWRRTTTLHGKDYYIELTSATSGGAIFLPLSHNLNKTWGSQAHNTQSVHDLGFKGFVWLSMASFAWKGISLTYFAKEKLRQGLIFLI